MFHIRDIDHVVLRTANPEQLVTFYEQVLGCPVEQRQAHVGLVQLRAGNSLIDIVDVRGKIGLAGGAAPGHEGRNMDHFCLRVEPWQPEAIRTHLEAHGINAGEVEQRYGADGEGPSIYLADPDGNGIELRGPANHEAAAS